MAWRDQAVYPRAHRLIIAEQVIDEERNEQQIQRGGRGIHRLKQSALQPAANDSPEPGLLCRVFELFGERAQVFVNRRAGSLELENQRLDAFAPGGERVRELIVGLQQLRPNA